MFRALQKEEMEENPQEKECKDFFISVTQVTSWHYFNVEIPKTKIEIIGKKPKYQWTY